VAAFAPRRRAHTGCLHRASTSSIATPRCDRSSAEHVDIKAFIDHFLTINCVDIAVFAQAEHEAIKTWLHMSSIEWKPDYGEYASMLAEVPVKRRK
jgi:hypothetical protein